MKSILRYPLFALGAFLAIPGPFTGCQQSPSSRVVQVQTLGTIGASAKAAMDGASQLLKSGQITVAQWQAIADFYDNRFQRAYNLAVNVVQSDLSGPASPDVIALSTQFLQLVAQLTAKPTP